MSAQERVPPPGAVLAIQRIGEFASRSLADEFDTGVGVEVMLGDLNDSGRFRCSISFEFYVRGMPGKAEEPPVVKDKALRGPREKRR